MSNSYNTTITMSKEEYETVAGYSLGPAPRNGQGSGGYYEAGITIMYFPNVGVGGGITGQGWYENNPNSPFYGHTPADIVNDYSEGDKNNLDSYFETWGESLTANRTLFLQQIPSNCWTV